MIKNKFFTSNPYRSSVFKFFTVLIVCVITFPQTFAEEISLTEKEKNNFVKYLFPLPQKIKLEEMAFSFKPQDFVLELDTEMTNLSKKFVTNFQQLWLKRYKTELKIKGSNENVTIYIGGATNFTPFKKAVSQNLLNLEELKNINNPDQAYSISCVKVDNKLSIYIAANQDAGLYNALATFEQLLSVMSTKKSIILPKIEILDWPDIKLRGIWGGLHKNNGKEFLKYSKMKLNAYWGPFVHADVSEDKKISYPSNKDIIDRGTNLNIHIVPILVHLDYMFKSGYAVGEHFADVVGTPGDKPFGWAKPWCFSNPKSQIVLDEMFEAIARDVGSDYLWMWPSEHGETCHCSNCKGDKRMQSIKEFQHILHAYKKAKKIRPNLHMSLITTQGTRDYNLELLKILPKEIGLDIYDGSLTYQNEITQPILTSFKPLMEEMRKEEREIGVVPMFAASHSPGNMLFPFNSPMLSKARMEEFNDEGLERTIAWIPPGIFVQEINGQSMAEFAWNANGRTTHEFLISWAVRKGLRKPEHVAEIITLLDHPERMLSIGMRADKFERPIERMASELMGKEPQWSVYFSMIEVFERGGGMDLPESLEACEKASQLAKKQGNKELICGTYLTKQWVHIFELYSEFLKDSSEEENIRVKISDLAEDLPGIWKDWIDTQSELSASNRDSAQEAFDSVMEVLRRIH